MAGKIQLYRRRAVFILDGAHNEDAARKLRESVEAYFPGRRLICIMGVFKDKEYDRIARIMGPLASMIYTVDLPDGKRGLPAEELAEVLKEYCPCVKCQGRYRQGEKHRSRSSQRRGRKGRDSMSQQSSVDCAVQAALLEAKRNDVILAFGSLSYLHQVKEAYDRAVW